MGEQDVPQGRAGGADLSHPETHSLSELALSLWNAEP